jgi:hypothetical protein
MRSQNGRKSLEFFLPTATILEASARPARTILAQPMRESTTDRSQRIRPDSRRIPLFLAGRGSPRPANEEDIRHKLESLDRSSGFPPGSSGTVKRHALSEDTAIGHNARSPV